MNKARVQYSSTRESVSSAAPEVTNEKSPIKIFSDDAVDLVANTDIAIDDSIFRKYCSKFHCPFQELQDHLEQCGCDVEIKIDLVFTNPPYNFR